mgnify:CR=1 FL=1
MPRLQGGAYLDNDVMCVLGTKYAHTPAQIGLRWATQKGISVIPKSVHPDRIRSNGNIFDFSAVVVFKTVLSLRYSICRLCTNYTIKFKLHGIIIYYFHIKRNP